MSKLIQIITGQGDDANQSVFEQDVEIHERNGIVRVNKVQLTPNKSNPRVFRTSLVERRRRRASLKF